MLSTKKLMKRPLSPFTGLLVALLVAGSSVRAADREPRGQVAPFFDSGIRVTETNVQVRVLWPISEKATGSAVFNMDESRPLIDSLGASAAGEAMQPILSGLN